MTFRAGAIVATGLLTCLLPPGCGGSSSSSDAPAAAAKQFVTAVTHDDRATWCGQIGQALMVAHRTGGLGASLGLQRSDGQWYVTSISGGSPNPIKQGRCAGAGGA